MDNKDDISRISIKTPPFYIKHVNIWFRQLESQFVLGGIKNSATKFHHAWAAIPENIAVDVPEDTLDTADYDSLKRSILQLSEKSTMTLLQEALKPVELGDDRPSHLLRTIRRSMKEADVNDDNIVRHQFMQAMPSNIRITLASHTGKALDELAMIADTLRDTLSVYGSQPLNINSTATTHDFHSEINALRREFDVFKRAKDANDSMFRRERNYTGPISEPPTTFPKFNSLCYYHLRFGRFARNCKPLEDGTPCRFNEQGNRWASPK